jgi:hypothetical protein
MIGIRYHGVCIYCIFTIEKGDEIMKREMRYKNGRRDMKREMRQWIISLRIIQTWALGLRSMMKFVKTISDPMR